MKIIICVVSFFSFYQLIIAAGESNTESVFQYKKGAAVTAFTKDDGFKLSKKSIENLEITFQPLKGSGPWIIPKQALVRIKYSTGVYRKWEGWITMVLVKILSQTKETVTIKSVDLQDKDNVAITGVSFLRMTEADLNSDTVDSCSH